VLSAERAGPRHGVRRRQQATSILCSVLPATFVRSPPCKAGRSGAAGGRTGCHGRTGDGRSLVRCAPYTQYPVEL